MNDKEETIQLVRSDGTLQILQKPLAAAQVIPESPQRSVCHSDSFYIGQKTPTISPNEKLKVGNKYFLPPQYFFHSPLSLILLASIISPPPPPKVPPTSTARLSAQLRSIERASVFCQPFELQKSDVCGSLRIRVCPEFISKLMKTEGFTLMNAAIQWAGILQTTKRLGFAIPLNYRKSILGEVQRSMLETETRDNLGKREDD